MRVRNSRRSSRIRARIANALPQIARPQNSTKGRRATSTGSVSPVGMAVSWDGWRSRPASTPSTNGTVIDASEMLTAARRSPCTVRGSSSSPTMNM